MKTPLFRTVFTLLSAAAALLIWVGARTIQASRDVSVRQGLDYRTFLRALDEITDASQETPLLTFHSVETRIGGLGTVTFDTLAIVADITAFPSLDRAGFLYDQVRAYNRFQRDRVAQAREFPDWFHRLRGFNPSVFRSYRRTDGALGLTRASSAWSLRVRSPLEGDWSGQVLAQDVHRGYGLLSPRVALSLRKPVRLQREVEGRRQLCKFTPSALEVRAYCLSEAPIPQAIFRLASKNPGRESWAVAGWDDLWVDGQRVRAGDSIGIPGGSLLKLNPLEPVIFSEYWEGVLSSPQWFNGRMRRRANLPPPLDLFEPLGSGPAAAGTRETPTADIRLSIRAEASAELTRQLHAFLSRELEIPLDFGMIVIARVPDGDILAVAEVGERRTRGRSPILERVSPGSAVKPLLAASILTERPDLARLKIPARTGKITSVLDLPAVPARQGFSTALNCGYPSDGQVDLRYFLRCSNNEYAASLLISGLVDEEMGGAGGGVGSLLVGREVPRSVLLRSPLSRGLHGLFDLSTDPTIADSTGRSHRVWDRLTFTDGAPVRVPWEALPDESRPALLGTGASEGTDLALLYRYAFGAWENRWTLLDLTNGFGRVVSDRRVNMRLHSPPEDGKAPPTLGLADQKWYPEFLAGLRGVALDGTAGGLRRSWVQEGLPSLVFAKTGTLAEAGEPGPLDDLYSKSLLFAVGEPASSGEETLGCGIVGGIYLRFERGPRTGSLSSYQVDFARRELGAFLAEHWEEMGICGHDGPS